MAFYGLKLNLEKSQRTVKNIRNILAARCKYWKTVCRYPVRKNEVLIIGVADGITLPCDIKFPQKCSFYTKHWRHNVSPIICVKSKDKKMNLLDLYQFKTGSPLHNKMIKNFAI